VVRGHLASGGMAEVYVAEMQLTKGVRRAVALKRIHAHLTSEPDLITMFLDEARVTGHLAHPCVIPLLDVFEVGSYALRFRWSEGGCQDGIYTFGYLRDLGKPFTG